MTADEFGSVMSPESVRAPQAIENAGKGQERKKKQKQEEPPPSKREEDSVHIESVEGKKEFSSVKVNTHNPVEDDIIPGSNFDVTVG